MNTVGMCATSCVKGCFGESFSQLPRGFRCSSKILLADTVDYDAHTFALPLMRQKKDMAAGDAVETEPLYHYWRAKDQFTFENAGFTFAGAGNIRYITCADCEIGPIGYVCSDTRKHFIAFDRVHHKVVNE